MGKSDKQTAEKIEDSQDKDSSLEHIFAVTGRTISDKEFKEFQSLVHREAGIWLSEAKKALLVGRLNKRLRALDMETYGDYYKYVAKEGGQQELTLMLDCICTNETRFFRETQHFEFLEDEVYPVWQEQADNGERPKCIKVWSAACSTGEEPYSLAMSLRYAFPADKGWDIQILASDLSTKALDQAREGNWPLDKSQDIPKDYLKAFMLKGVGSQDGRMTAGNKLRSMIRFMRLNLNDDEYPLERDFDMIFCRNVLIYFNQDSKGRVIDKLADHLVPGGFIFLGHAESLNHDVVRFKRAASNVYRYTGESGRDIAPGPKTKAAQKSATARE